MLEVNTIAHLIEQLIDFVDNMWWMYFNGRPHGRGAVFTGQCIMWHSDTNKLGALQLAAAVPLSCRYWWLNDPFCCVHRSRDSAAFQLAGQPPKLPLPAVITTLLHGSLAPLEPAP